MVNPEVLRRVLPRLANRANTPGGNLTNRELEVLGLVVAGMRISGGGGAGVGPVTAHVHLRSIIPSWTPERGSNRRTTLLPKEPRGSWTRPGARPVRALIEAAELARTVRRIAEDRRDRGGIKARTSTLTVRDWEVQQSLARGETNDAIASALFISANTVRTQNRNILGKLGVHSKLQAVAVAAQAGVLSM